MNTPVSSPPPVSPVFPASPVSSEESTPSVIEPALTDTGTYGARAKERQTTSMEPIDPVETIDLTGDAAPSTQRSGYKADTNSGKIVMVESDSDDSNRCPFTEEDVSSQAVVASKTSGKAKKRVRVYPAGMYERRTRSGGRVDANAAVSVGTGQSGEVEIKEESEDDGGVALRDAPVQEEGSGRKLRSAGKPALAAVGKAAEFEAPRTPPGSGHLEVLATPPAPKKRKRTASDVVEWPYAGERRKTKKETGKEAATFETSRTPTKSSRPRVPATRSASAKRKRTSDTVPESSSTGERQKSEKKEAEEPLRRSARIAGRNAGKRLSR